MLKYRKIRCLGMFEISCGFSLDYVRVCNMERGFFFIAGFFYNELAIAHYVLRVFSLYSQVYFHLYTHSFHLRISVIFLREVTHYLRITCTYMQLLLLSSNFDPRSILSLQIYATKKSRQPIPS